MSRIRTHSPLHRILRIIPAALLLALALVGGAPASAQEFDRLGGWLVPTAGSLPVGDGFLDLHLSGVTTESDLAGYSRLVRQRGERALLNRLADEDLGRFSVGAALGRPIVLVQESRDEGLRHVVVVVERELSPAEIFGATRSSRYPYTVVDVTLDADGEGYGELHPAARLRISPDGKLSYTPLEPMPLRILELSAS